MRVFLFISILAQALSAVLKLDVSSLDIAVNTVDSGQGSQTAKEFMVHPPQEHDVGSSYTRDRGCVEEILMCRTCTLVKLDG